MWANSKKEAIRSLFQYFFVLFKKVYHATISKKVQMIIININVLVATIMDNMIEKYHIITD